MEAQRVLGNATISSVLLPLDLTFSGKPDTNRFGPRLEGYFDFTLLFEQSILSILPSVLFLLIAPWRILSIYNKQSIVKPGHLLVPKLLTCAIIFGLQAGLLCLWTLSASPTDASIPSAALGVVDTTVLGILSWLEHSRSIGPSILVGAYLWLSLLLDFAQLRSLYLQHALLSNITPIAITFTIAKVALFILLFLEEIPKRKLLPGKPEDYAAETTSGPLNRSLFWWLNDLFLVGFKSELGPENLGEIDETFSSHALLTALKGKWEDFKGRDWKHPLFWATCSAFKTPILLPIIPRVLSSGFHFAQPFLIDRIITFVNRPDEECGEKIGLGLIAATALAYIGMAIAHNLYEHFIYRLNTVIRGGLVSIVFDKTTKVDATGESNEAALSLMSTDVEGIVSGVKDVHEVWACAVELCIALWLLQRQIGAACFLVAIPAITCTFVTSSISDGIGPARGQWAQATQTRVSVTSTMLSQIKGLKMMGLTDYASESLRKLRIHELEVSKKFRNFIVWIITIANISNELTPAVIITAAIFWTRSGPGGFTVNEAFTSLSIVALISTPIAELTAVYPQFVASLACFDRIQTFLSSDERQDGRQKKRSEQQSGAYGSLGTDGARQVAVSVKDASVEIPRKTDLILRNATFDVVKGSFNVIVGPVGSGKSSLLKAILGELPLSEGTISLDGNMTSSAFCDQTCWLRNGSVRDNILAGSELDQAWYDSVVRACALSQDISQFPKGDRTIVGSGGITLSGGQKQTVALARALYAHKELILLDDVLSALDVETARSIFNALLGPGGLLKEGGKTVILVTHAVHYLPAADQIIVVENGTISQQGHFSELRSVDGFVKNLAINDMNTSENSNHGTDIQSPAEPAKAILVDEPKVKDSSAQTTGDLSLYKFYLSSVHPAFAFGFLVLGFGYQIMGQMPAIWLRFWVDHGTTSSDSFIYFAVYILFGLLTVAFSALAPWWLMILVIPRSGVHLHQLLLDAYLNSPLWFQTGTDKGVTLNRFSQDMGLVDQSLPMAFFEVTLDTANILTTGAIVASGAPYLAAIMPLCFIPIYFLQQFYLKTSRQMRRMDLETKAPLYTHFTETMSGVVTIRAFGWEDAFLEENLKLLDISQKPYYLMFCIQRWLSLVMGVFAAVVSITLVTFAVRFTDVTSGGAIGLAMLSMMGFQTALSRVVAAWTGLETSFGAAARTRDFVKQTPIESLPQETGDLADDWPNLGSLEIHAMNAAYQPDAQPILNSIALSIKPGQKVGICGRTGSGKSSLLLSFLHLLEVKFGNISIDGSDLLTINREQLRKKLTVLPQDPIKLPGTARHNLVIGTTELLGGANAEDNDEDAALISALKKTGIWEKVELSGGLDAEYSSLSLSHGQQQLFAIARVLLSASKIVLLDEATSSVDKTTDEMVQAVLREALKDSTVITVAHRLESIIDNDVIVVMNGGKILEVGEPPELLNDDQSMFKAMWNGRMS